MNTMPAKKRKIPHLKAHSMLRYLQVTPPLHSAALSPAAIKSPNKTALLLYRSIPLPKVGCQLMVSGRPQSIPLDPNASSEAQLEAVLADTHYLLPELRQLTSAR